MKQKLACAWHFKDGENIYGCKVGKVMSAYRKERLETDNNKIEKCQARGYG